ncbi:tetratricopeptide repeat protein 31 isoform X2 [Melanotaenia boesemani]|uniref:tetratricopeptide repeat protein 31 isoform X2 n=1 Tax=Melanotaenia boesemani TaxID=1250792 RepID=UPI001C057D98|nr:tetratricopeptide repeat protein 31 isoform X2 [Melanotaenia boesemani]
MPKKREIVKGGPPVSRIRENSRLMRTHESMVDYLSGRSSGGSFMDMLAPSFFGLNLFGSLEDDLLYSDEDDDSDDSLLHRPHHAAHRALEPHPQIKQLTDEEADKIAKELMLEEDRRNGKMQKNKRKKMRKKEKKRLEKENALKDSLPEEEEEEQGKPGSEEDNQKESSTICSNLEANESPKSDGSQTASEGAGCDEDRVNLEEKDHVLKNKKEDEKQKDLGLNNSHAELVPEEVCNQNPTKVRKKDKVEAQQPKEEKSEVAEKPQVQKKKEQEAAKEKTGNPTAEEFAKRSVELANTGNRLFASGQYEMAVKCFTDAIKYNPKEFKLFGNRSLCYERLQQYENALRDADVALSMEPNWIKGLFRKGKALCGLRRYYEASLIYKEVLKLESTSTEAAQELKRAQTLHLMEMGFSWAQCSEALKTHGTLEEAVEALFALDGSPGSRVIGSNEVKTEQPVKLECSSEGEWEIVQQTSRPRTQHVKELDLYGQSRSTSQSPTHLPRSSVKPELFPVWVGTLGPSMTYAKLHELFSRAGTIYSIKMLLERQCAFVNYTRKDDCDKAIQCINGMVVEGSPLTVRHPFKFNTSLNASKNGNTDGSPRPDSYKKECFFWRTTGCTRQDCTFRHIPENKNIDKDKFTSRLGFAGRS